MKKLAKPLGAGLLALALCVSLTGCVGLGDVLYMLVGGAAGADSSSSSSSSQAVSSSSEPESSSASSSSSQSEASSQPVSSSSVPEPVAEAPAPDPAPESQQAPAPPPQSPYIGTFYENSGQYAPEYTPRITFAADGSFDLLVNLLEGMGNIYGTYTETNGYIECTVTSRNFMGFAGDAMGFFTFTAIDTNTLVYSGEQVGLMGSGTYFLR